MATSPPDFASIKQRQRKMWTKGNFAAVATPLVVVSENLCEAVDLRAGSRVLDVACGSGNTAIAAARRNCIVTGVDFVPELLERGRERATVERLHVDFEPGDAEQLPYHDASFDVVLSTFGTMFAPDQERAAAEMIRVCRAGGKVGMANWTPEGWVSTMFRIVSKYAPPPSNVKPPTRWGTEQGLRELFDNHVSDMAIEHRVFTSRYTSPEHWLDFFRTNFGPMATAFASLDTMGGQLLADELLDAARAANRGADGTFAADSGYLEIVATRR